MTTIEAMRGLMLLAGSSAVALAKFDYIYDLIDFETFEARIEEALLTERPLARLRCF